MENEIIQYYIVNKDITMSPGKLAAQVAHVATIIAMDNFHESYFQEWFNNDQKKIILKGKEKTLLRLIEHPFVYYIRDNGLTEIPKGTLTAIGFIPMYRSEAQEYIKRLQLY
jgi:PTH2 family peptidyl-tRNA hydrolase